MFKGQIYTFSGIKNLSLRGFYTEIRLGFSSRIYFCSVKFYREEAIVSTNTAPFRPLDP